MVQAIVIDDDVVGMIEDDGREEAVIPERGRLARPIFSCPHHHHLVLSYRYIYADTYRKLPICLQRIFLSTPTLEVEPRTQRPEETTPQDQRLDTYLIVLLIPVIQLVYLSLKK